MLRQLIKVRWKLFMSYLIKTLRIYFLRGTISSLKFVDVENAWEKSFWANFGLQWIIFNSVSSFLGIFLTLDCVANLDDCFWFQVIFLIFHNKMSNFGKHEALAFFLVNVDIQFSFCVNLLSVFISISFAYALSLSLFLSLGADHIWS